jgi:ABC-2 type transport system permease protein
MIMGAVVIHSTIMIITSSMSFWVVKSHAEPRDDNIDVRRFIEYPISRYDKWIKFILTFIIPYSFVNYYPC